MSEIITPTPETTSTLIRHTPPLWLKHRPLFMMPYEPFDGPYAGDTDAKYLSVGIAQWNEGGGQELSAKVWRFTNNKWSRQSEELPLHRVIDLCIFIVKTLINRSLRIESGVYTKQMEEIRLNQLEGQFPEEELAEARPFLKKRLRVLRDLLNNSDLD
jgi:hypothetical protein